MKLPLMLKMRNLREILKRIKEGFIHKELWSSNLFKRWRCIRIRWIPKKLTLIYKSLLLGMRRIEILGGNLMLFTKSIISSLMLKIKSMPRTLDKLQGYPDMEIEELLPQKRISILRAKLELAMLTSLRFTKLDPSHTMFLR